MGAGSSILTDTSPAHTDTAAGTALPSPTGCSAVRLTPSECTEVGTPPAHIADRTPGPRAQRQAPAPASRKLALGNAADMHHVLSDSQPRTWCMSQLDEKCDDRLRGYVSWCHDPDL